MAASSSLSRRAARWTRISRLLQPHLQQALGQTIVVENRAGASGSIGSAVVAKAAADGNILVVGVDTTA